jgi:hypothetical protein
MGRNEAAEEELIWLESAGESHMRDPKYLSFALLNCIAVSLNGTTHAADTNLRAISHDQLCVTEGAIEDVGTRRLAVNVPKMRAYVEERTAPAVQMRFQYLGSTGNEGRLGSGELRRQFGLKLRAQDACNLVYAMWRVEPESKLVVSVKANPGQHSSAQCGNRGYRNIKPRRAGPLPQLRPGETHSLLGEMRGEEMRVFVDDQLVWDGSVSGALEFDGPVGIRSDNARLEFELRSGQPVRPAEPISCRSGDSD